MKIAVLMSTYNGSKYLNQQLESLANQTVANNMTVYIRDDGSSDDTIDIINTWSRKLKINCYSGTNVGAARSFWELFVNQDINADYYAFCDQDDIWDSDKLEISVKHLTEDVCLYTCNCRVIDENGRVLKNRYSNIPPYVDIKNMIISGFTQGCSMTFTNELREFVLNKKIETITMHDSILAIYSMFFGRIYWDSEPRFSYRIHGNNVIAKSNKSFIQKAISTIKFWRKISKTSKSLVASELTRNIDILDNADRIFLKNVSAYKKSLKAKWNLILLKKPNGVTKRSMDSFKIRVLLDLF